MAIITIQLDNSVPEDQAILVQLFSTPKKEDTITVVKHEPSPKAPPKVAEPAPKPKVAEPAKEEPVEDLISDGPSLRAQAVQKATELVTSGRSADVRQALADLGAKRVSDLADDQIESFLVALK